MTVEQLRQLERVTFECNYCERGHSCSYHEGWLDALDLARVPELLDIAEAAQDVVPSTEFLDDIPGPYAYVRVDELKAVADALSRLDDR